MNGAEGRARGGAAQPSTQLALLLGILLALTSCSTLTSEVTWKSEEGLLGSPVQARFVGNENISRFSLFRKIEDLLYDISKAPERKSPAYDAALAIEDFYRAEGFPRPSVEHTIERREQVVVTFTIQEGPLVVIDELEIRDNHSIQDDELLQYLPTRSSGALGFGRPIFVERVLEGFASDIETRYAREGYLDAKVRGPELTFIEEGKAVRVLFFVREGPLYTLRRIQVAPALAQAAEGWKPDELSGEPFGSNIASAAQLSLRSQLRKLGYPSPRVQALARPVKEGDVAKQVDLLLQGEPGPRAVIQEIVIEGNEKTRSSVIRNRIELRQGERFDGELEDESLRKLYRTGLFKKVTVRYEPLSEGSQDFRAIFVTEELPSQLIEFSAGYGSYELGRLGAKYEENNLFGTGLDLIWTGKVSFRDLRTGLTVVEPDFLIDELRFSVGGEWFQREEPSYTDRGYRLDAIFDRQLYSDLHGRLGYEYSSRNGADVEVPEIDPALGDYSKGEVFADLLWDQRDNPIVTREGRQLTTRFSYAGEGLGGDVEFFRVSGKAVQYVPFSRSTRLVLRYESSALFPQQGSNRIPLQERIFNGGSTTVRSYGYKELGPKSINGKPLGGEFRQVASAELRFPLPFPLPILGRPKPPPSSMPATSAAPSRTGASKT
jgi:outer membrane protein insertion porin family